MELDDLRSAWQSLDQKLDQQYALELRSLRELKLGRLRQHLRMLTAGRMFQLLSGLALTIVMGQFWISHMQELHLLISGVLLHLYGIMLIISSAREFYLINRVDYAASVLVIQRELAELRRWHITEAVLFGVTGCVIWVPVMLVAFQILFDVDIYASVPVLVWDLVLSTVLFTAVVAGLWRWTRGPGRSSIPRRVADHVVGKTMVRAESVVAELSRFEQDF